MYVLSFLFGLHTALPAYINSSFLSIFSSEQAVGLIYTIASIVTIAFLFCISALLKKFGDYRTIIALIGVLFISLLGLATLKSPNLIFIFFIVTFTTLSLVGFIMDVLLESFSKDATTGGVRGIFLTSANVAWVISPAIAGLIIAGGDYGKIFLAAAILLLPILFLVQYHFKNFKDPRYEKLPFMGKTKKIGGDKNLFGIFVIAFLLQFFYAWMVIYTPIYLHEYVGFSWVQIGVIFSFMLLPFIITEIPLGKLADSQLGEKELLSIGFIIMAISTGMISFITGKEIFLWGAVLFITRVGASMVEIMSEAYFWKHVTSADVGVISFFRTTRPWAYLVGPLIASVFLWFLPFKYIFIALGILMFWGLRYSLTIEDTR